MLLQDVTDHTELKFPNYKRKMNYHIKIQVLIFYFS